MTTMIYQLTCFHAGLKQTVHENRFGYIIRVVPSNDMIDPQLCCPSIKGLTSENTAERAYDSDQFETESERLRRRTVIPPSDLLHYLVHCPSIQLVIGKDLEWETIFDLVLLDRLSAQSKVSY